MISRAQRVVDSDLLGRPHHLDHAGRAQVPPRPGGGTRPLDTLRPPGKVSRSTWASSSTFLAPPRAAAGHGWPAESGRVSSSPDSAPGL